ncbi:MAG: hypothetical protein JWM90_1976 [Thermoleophilia bacterium]|nr:hypothetical protein [Thermoleophilia bacterium]
MNIAPQAPQLPASASELQMRYPVAQLTFTDAKGAPSTYSVGTMILEDMEAVASSSLSDAVKAASLLAQQPQVGTIGVFQIQDGSHILAKLFAGDMSQLPFEATGAGYTTSAEGVDPGLRALVGETTWIDLTGGPGIPTNAVPLPR